MQYSPPHRRPPLERDPIDRARASEERDTESVVFCWSKTADTEKAAHALPDGLGEGGAPVLVTTGQEAGEVDSCDCDLVCVAFPSYHWPPPEQMVRFLKRNHNRYVPKNRAVR